MVFEVRVVESGDDFWVSAHAVVDDEIKERMEACVPTQALALEEAARFLRELAEAWEVPEWLN